MLLTSSLAAIAFLGCTTALYAQTTDFNVTYHIERTHAAQLSIESCGKAVMDAAREAGLEAVSENTPEKLVTVSGGSSGKGAFLVQCIAVDDKTISVVQGIDYSPEKGALGDFADLAAKKVKDAVH